VYPSIGRVLPAALWDERELKDMLGIAPEGHPDPRRLVLHDSYPPGFHPLRRDAPAEVPPGPSQRRYVPFTAHGEGVYQLPVGPIHAGVIEPGHFRFSVVGESILHLDARLFFTHRGVEKLVEGRPVHRALEVLERSCGVCTVAHATAFCEAVERLAGTEPPVRAVRLRAVLAELERLYNHIGDLGNICAGASFNVGSSQLGWLKERLLRINEAVTGHRYLTGAVAPGGLVIQPTADVLAEVPGRLAEVEAELLAILHLINRADAVLERFRGTGVLPADTARRLGTVGVAARASGLPIDLRRDRPSGAYRDLIVPLVESASGDVAARFHVRAQEAIASLGLLRTLLSDLPAGPVRAAIGPIEPWATTLGWAEGPRGASWLWLRAGAGGTVDRLRLRSASYANWTAVAAAAPGNLVPDFPLINKSFELCYACTDR
jgi:Ni,Fe-hydrogenase III large subunit